MSTARPPPDQIEGRAKIAKVVVGLVLATLLILAHFTMDVGWPGVICVLGGYLVARNADGTVGEGRAEIAKVALGLVFATLLILAHFTMNGGSRDLTLGLIGWSVAGLVNLLSRVLNK